VIREIAHNATEDFIWTSRPIATYCPVIAPRLTFRETAMNVNRSSSWISSHSVCFYPLIVSGPCRTIFVLSVIPVSMLTRRACAVWWLRIARWLLLKDSVFNVMLNSILISMQNAPFFLKIVAGRNPMEDVPSVIRVGRLIVQAIVLSYLPIASISMLTQTVRAASLGISWMIWWTVSNCRLIVLSQIQRVSVRSVKMVLNLKMILVLNYQMVVPLLMVMKYVILVWLVGILTVQIIVFSLLMDALQLIKMVHVMRAYQDIINFERVFVNGCLCIVQKLMGRVFVRNANKDLTWMYLENATWLQDRLFKTQLRIWTASHRIKMELVPYAVIITHFLRGLVNQQDRTQNAQDLKPIKHVQLVFINSNTT